MLPTLPDLLLPEGRANPYPLYEQLRATSPVHWDQWWQVWAITRYEDVVSALCDRRLSSQQTVVQPELVSTLAERLPMEVQAAASSVYQAYARQMVFLDGADHARVRSRMAAAFTARQIERLRPHVQQHVDNLLSLAFAKGQMDIIADFADPLAAVVITDLLGMPSEHQDRLTAWYRDLCVPINMHETSPAREARAIRSATKFLEYILDLVSAGGHTLRDGGMKQYLASGEPGEKLDAAELVANCALLLLAGFESTIHLIGNGVRALLGSV